MEPETGFKLRCELHGHEEDVRAKSVGTSWAQDLLQLKCSKHPHLLILQVRSTCVGEIGIVTSSRDTTVKIWAEESATAYSLLHTLVRHQQRAHYVAAHFTAVCTSLLMVVYMHNRNSAEA